KSTIAQFVNLGFCLNQDMKWLILSAHAFESGGQVVRRLGHCGELLLLVEIVPLTKVTNTCGEISPLQFQVAACKVHCANLPSFKIFEYCLGLPKPSQRSKTHHTLRANPFRMVGPPRPRRVLCCRVAPEICGQSPFHSIGRIATPPDQFEFLG